MNGDPTDGVETELSRKTVTSFTLPSGSEVQHMAPLAKLPVIEDVRGSTLLRLAVRVAFERLLLSLLKRL